MSIEAAWATAAVIAALPLALVIAPVAGGIVIRLRRRFGIAAALRGNADG